LLVCAINYTIYPTAVYLDAVLIHFSTSTSSATVALYKLYYRIIMMVMVTMMMITVDDDDDVIVDAAVAAAIAFYASAQSSVVAGGTVIVVLSCSSVRASMHPCVHTETLLTRYLAEYLTQFYQTYISSALWDRDERFTFGIKKSKVKVTVE